MIIQGGSKKRSFKHKLLFGIIGAGSNGKKFAEQFAREDLLHNMKEEITRFESRRKKITFGRRRENNNKNSDKKPNV